MMTATPLSARPPVVPVILAGGGATRFGGRPKGLESVGGRRILDRLVDSSLVAFGTLPLLIANDPAATDWRPDLEVRPDLRPGLGALGGLHAAVSAGAGGPVVVMAWDMPFVPASLLTDLAGRLAKADAALPASDGRRGVEPLLAAYGAACLGPIERALDRGDRRVIAFHDDVRVDIVPLEIVRRHGDPSDIFLNVNTADDLSHAEARWLALGSVRS